MTNGRSRSLLSGILGVCLACMTGAAPAQEQPRRMSLAISGGASKGAYEAGLNWAALKIMREAAEAPAVVGGRFRPFEAASFAGASAGGINTLLSGLAWCAKPETEGGLPNSIGDNVFRDVWLTPDINDLLPVEPDSPTYLRGDATLSRRSLIEAANALADQWRSPAFRSGCRVPLGVTLTRVEPEVLQVGEVQVPNQRFYIPFELRVQADNSVGFFFDPGEYPSVRDAAMILLPRSRDAAPFSISSQRVQNAVLTTSAFPVAFGRRRLQYCWSSAFRIADAGRPASGPGTQGTDELVCPEGYELAEAVFADGGLFDNLPLGVARILAERNTGATANALPVTYYYLDPDRTRYRIPDPKAPRACDRPDPPAACRTMEFSLASESALLFSFLGTARKYQLYRELTGDQWALNLPVLSDVLADALQTQDPGFRCQSEIDLFDRRLDCPEALRRGGRLLELAYSRIEVAITPPYSVEKLFKAGVAEDCRRSTASADIEVSAECSIDIPRYRTQLAQALVAVLERAKLSAPELEQRIRRSRFTAQNDRIIRVTSRGAPITGTLLSDFGAFLEYKFREYDYYAGVYDAIVVASGSLCSLHFTPAQQRGEYRECFDQTAKQVYEILGVETDPKARAAVAMLGRDEFAGTGLLGFAYQPMPAEDRDMHIIHDALAKTLEAGHGGSDDERDAFSVEVEFFQHLRAEGFTPTVTDAGEEPLLAQIMADPEFWSTELVRRTTDRLVHLERQAEEVYEAREPDPAKREVAHTTTMGASAYVLQTGTYKYPRFAWAPSTAPKGWIWRGVIPYEVALDTAEGDVLLTWQPTWSVSPRDNLAIRGSIGLAGGLLKDSSYEDREDYLSLGLDYTRLRKGTLSGLGFTPGWYHAFKKPKTGNQDGFGFDVHAGFFKNRLRVGLGTRDVSEASENWFLTLGVADLPGIVYWLSR
jgi:hypothetical protein